MPRVVGQDDTRRIEYNGLLELELLKYHYRFTDEQWYSLDQEERTTKLAVFRILQTHPELRG